MGKIKRYDPFWGIDSFRRDMDRLFDSFFGRWPSEGYPTLWGPAVDIEETKDSLVVRAEIPGMKKEDIKIQTVGDNLVISGERRHEAEEKDRHFHRVEHAYGKFQRVVSLPIEVESDKAKASYKEGVLEITFPKSDKARAKEIEVE
ncbi:molecular chaperone [candidate division TA06 bacterium B3_TA06]|uniref:Molecular chaperone n=1 Tax=candidate division TA06 bacterium B3_TA06 TaxID=2012487 RepID=A0A532V7Y2_UNCT6|nr:MAG: molecular chaperone [candidate division TA06 bacterium B3_TA06]